MNHLHPREGLMSVLQQPNFKNMTTQLEDDVDLAQNRRGQRRYIGSAFPGLPPGRQAIPVVPPAPPRSGPSISLTPLPASQALALWSLSSWAVASHASSSCSLICAKVIPSTPGAPAFMRASASLMLRPAK